MKNVGVMGFLFGIFFVITLLKGIISYSTLGTVTFQVEDKERITSGQRGYYLVFTDKGVYKNTDSFLMWKFNSSDLQGHLKVGESYTCKTNWFRFGLTSSYKNVLSCTDE